MQKKSQIYEVTTWYFLEIILKLSHCHSKSLQDFIVMAHIQFPVNIRM